MAQASKSKMPSRYYLLNGPRDSAPDRCQMDAGSDRVRPRCHACKPAWQNRGMYPYSPHGHEPRQWFDRTQPQTLQIAVILLYVNAGLTLLMLLLLGAAGAFGSVALLYALVTVANGVPAFGIANNRKWAYIAAVVLSSISLLLVLANFVTTGPSSLDSLLNMAFTVALFALLVHPQSREYKRIWFK